MPDAISVDVAKNVTAYIQDAVDGGDTFDLEFDLERSYGDWDYPLKKIDTLRVDVVVLATKIECELIARGQQIAYDVPVRLCIRKKLGPDASNDDTGRLDIATIDSLMLFVEQLHELFLEVRLPDSLSSIWQETKILAAPNASHLLKHRQFTSLIEVNFRVCKSLA